MNTQLVLEGRLTSARMQALAQGVVVGYQAATEIVSSSPVLAQFQPGRGLRGHLIDPCVQYALDQMAARTGLFHTEPTANAAHNHFHHRIHAPGVCITTHFSGARADRGTARAAVNRAELNARCADLFAHEEPDQFLLDEAASEGPIYAHLLHGGVEAPCSIVLAIPSREPVVRYPLAPWKLEIPEADRAEVERVAERIEFELSQNPRKSTREAS